MISSQPKGQAVHEPGPIVLAMLGDMLWDDSGAGASDSTFWSRWRFQFGCCGHQSFFYRDGRRGD